LHSCTTYYYVFQYVIDSNLAIESIVPNSTYVPVKRSSYSEDATAAIPVDAKEGALRNEAIQQPHQLPYSTTACDYNSITIRTMNYYFLYFIILKSIPTQPIP
jgi:hypothetical protein